MQGYIQEFPGSTQWKEVFVSETKTGPIFDTFLVSTASLKATEEEVRKKLAAKGSVSRFEVRRKGGEVVICLGVLSKDERKSGSKRVVC